MRSTPLAGAASLAILAAAVAPAYAQGGPDGPAYAQGGQAGPAAHSQAKLTEIALIEAPRLALPPTSSDHVTPLRTAVLKHITARRARADGKSNSGRWLNELGSFYANPDNEPIFVRDGRLTPAAGELMEELGRAGDWGLDAANYDVPAAYGDLDTEADQARAEIELALVALKYVFHAHGGRFKSTDISLWFDMAAKRPHAGRTLKRLSRASNVAAEIRKAHPTHPQFVALREAYLDIIKPNRRRADAEQAPPRPEDIRLSYGASVREGRRHPQIALLRQRLEVPADDPADATLYDRELRNAVNAFMRTQGWRRKYVYDDKVRRKLNAAGSRRNGGGRITKEKLLVNMEKWRLVPRNLGAFHIWNNIPEYRTEVVKNGEVIHSERIIVGKSSTQTPVFHDKITHIVFKPEWGVPSSIKIKSLLPRLASGDYGVLSRRGMRIKLDGRQGNPRNIRWHSTDIRRIPIVQGPGPSNPLGRMKFMFPNKHAVYMHDTPKRHLFKTRKRTHSHGCIRVRNPQTLAEIITREQLGWSREDVAAHLRRRAEANNRIDLKTPIPVYNTYFTVIADENGKLQPLSDIYGHDQRIAKALSGTPLNVIARSDPARLHKQKIEALAENIPVTQPRRARYASNSGNSFEGPTYSLGGFWGQPQPSYQKKYKKKYVKKKQYKPKTYHNQALFQPFWDTD